MEIVGLVPLLVKESHVDERDLNVIGESPIKLGGRERLYIFIYNKVFTSKLAKNYSKNQVRGEKERYKKS